MGYKVHEEGLYESEIGFSVGGECFTLKGKGKRYSELKEKADRFVKIYFKTEYYTVHTAIETLCRRPIKSRTFKARARQSR